MHLANQSQPFESPVITELTDKINASSCFTDSEKRVLHMSLQNLQLTMEQHRIDQELALQEAIDELINPAGANPLLSGIAGKHSLN